MKKPLTPEQERKRAQKAELEARLASEKAAVRTARVHALADKLRDKLALYSEQANGEDDVQIAEGVRTMWRIEADELRNESYGVELLHAVGTVYTMKVRAGSPRAAVSCASFDGTLVNLADIYHFRSACPY